MESQNLELDTSLEKVAEYKFEPIKGFPMLNWKGKRPFKGTKYFPAQLKEVHGEDINGWLNKIFWGDNIQVMSHLLKEYRGQVDLIYIDPPFDSKADYKKKINLKGMEVTNDTSMFEEKQYTDMWSNDEYLQFMYERLVLLRELLSDQGSIYLHCDWHKVHHLRCIMDEIFGEKNLVNEIIWKRRMSKTSPDANRIENIVDYLLVYSKTDDKIFNSQFTQHGAEEYIKSSFNQTDANGRKYQSTALNAPAPRPTLMYDFMGYKPGRNGWSVKPEVMQRYYDEGKLLLPSNKDGRIRRKQYLDEWQGYEVNSLWTDIPVIASQSHERLDYPTQKPEALLERIIKMSSNQSSIILDCFMGSGTTMAAAQKLGRRFIGADINLGAIQTTTKRLLNIVDENKYLDLIKDDEYKGCGFEVFNVNNYDVFRNPVQAKDLLIEALEIDPLGNSSYFDGMKDGQKVKIMPVNRIATKADVSNLIMNLDYKAYEELSKENSKAKVDDILLVCMGHDPDIKGHFKNECPYNINIDIYDILKDGSELVFKRESEAQIVIDGNQLKIQKFYPNSLLEKLRQDGTEVEDYREMVESIMIDTNYDGSVFEPKIVDIPDKKELVLGEYELPEDRGTVAIKITDLVSETYFEVMSNG
ncbi:MAG: site-specific DNA-methyltransferase [Sulfuricurvum sp.]|uniref:site-specific DNA-methyltransferase n=1 Tax=Sulfuricurvum sp. TaxID=2025608 RepID=UPI00262E4919|nr:site-specific DNA-methyltransferase [Sulfuricurvum sp.]MDD2367739.1 site-specific DNA-methyltransferase [Sulfuricurvum sp.]MDD2950894.1 site-specific DNA-methyltransferase [Sulfuricurvum sp.]MDD5118159.1 site-specific DNA-methyltransferase [Sulfuricurvum sp.]